MKSITVNMHDDASGYLVEHELPAKLQVCSDCEGEGTHLTPALRAHSYSSEEFFEEFDEDEREAYFTRGGMYDVTCQTCKGKNVELVVDMAALELDDKELFKRYVIQLREDEDFRDMQASERRMGA